jgi:hypothetical protein
MLEPREKIAVEVQLDDLGTDLPEGLVARVRSPVDAQAVEDDNLQLVQAGLLLADLVKANLLGYLARDDDLGAGRDGSLVGRDL